MAYGYGIGGVLETWSQYGVFAYVLPFLMIFAVVFGILSKTKLLGENKGVQATIALAVGLLALQYDYVSNFFASIFPYTGMGLAVLLVALILMGLISNEKWSQFVWFGIGVIIFIVVVLASLEDMQWWGGIGYGGYDWPAILIAVLVLALLALIIWGGGKAASS